MRKLFILATILLFISSYGQKLDIAEVDFQASVCFGACPGFGMKIKKNGEADYNAVQYNKLKGQFKAAIKKSQINELFKLIDKTDFFNLKENYSTTESDNPTYTITVTLKNGQIKKIEDYGPSGPGNLKQVYDLIFSLRDSQDWK
jgi:hypothetical protein